MLLLFYKVVSINLSEPKKWRDAPASKLYQPTKPKNRPNPRVGSDLKLVENTGVEPVTSCMPCKRSSQLS